MVTSDTLPESTESHSSLKMSLENGADVSGHTLLVTHASHCLLLVPCRNFSGLQHHFYTWVCRSILKYSWRRAKCSDRFL
ncbi:hypothetical protein L208DRAFT_1415967 [Tricholoma matsutake]|nr:hypothetical protein L208DRAFT_1415967 [Tricholoma matsutake 945]